MNDDWILGALGAALFGTFIWLVVVLSVTFAEDDISEHCKKYGMVELEGRMYECQKVGG